MAADMCAVENISHFNFTQPQVELLVKVTLTSNNIQYDSANTLIECLTDRIVVRTRATVSPNNTCSAVQECTYVFKTHNIEALFRQRLGMADKENTFKVEINPNDFQPLKVTVKSFMRVKGDGSFVR